MSEAPSPTRPARGSATARRRRQVAWGRGLRRVGLAWQNALEIIRAGRLTAPYGAPFDVVHEDAIHKLRHYHPIAGATLPRSAPILLVPPLMVASEVYDIAPDVSAVAFLGRAGVDVWMTDFGAPEREAGGMDRTLDDHVRAVSEAIDRIHALTDRDVHLAGYSQGGMFAYQTAAFRRSAGVASIITMGSPVDIHRNVRLADQLVERLVAGIQRAIAKPLERIEGLPGFLTSTGFKLLSARKEAAQLFDFVRKLHDRQALEKREARRLFLGGEGFVAWPGPALRKFVDEIIVANRMTSGGIVIDGQAVTLADIDSPILYFVGDRDAMGRPAAVRGIRRAAPAADELFEVVVKAGHFGLVVGRTALEVTWPTVVEWIRWRDGDGPQPARPVAARVPAATGDAHEHAHDDGADGAHDDDDDMIDDTALGEVTFDLELAQDVVGKTAANLWERVGDAADDLGDYLDNLRWQLPRLRRLRNLRDDTRISIASVLAEKAAARPDGTFFLWRDRAFTYADANRRVDAVVRGLIASGVRFGQRIAVVMRGRPSLLSAVTALSRLGAVAILMSPETPAAAMPRAFEVGEPDAVLADPDSAAAVRAAWSGRLLVLGAVHERRALPAGAVDLEAIDPAKVVLPGWYRPDPGRARDLAIVFVSSGRHEPPRASRITNRRWAVSALGAAATCTLTPRDTVYCCLPLHHPTGMLVAVSSAVVGSARLALASEPVSGAAFDPEVFWREVRRYGVTIVYYAGEMCRSLIAAPPTISEQNHPVRLFAGSGMRPDLWRKLKQRFTGAGVLEYYASSEASVVLANASGAKLGAVGRPLPGSPELALAAYDLDVDDFVRDTSGRLVRARIDQPGMLIVRLDSPRGRADLANLAPTRILHDALGAGDTWFVTGDLLSIDDAGDYWYVDRHGDTIHTAAGPVASRRIEDALHEVTEVRGCVAVGIPDPGSTGLPRTPVRVSSPGIVIPPDDDGDHTVAKELPAAAFSLIAGAPPDLAALARAVVALPAHARPVRVRLVDELAMNDGFRPLKAPVRDAGFADGPRVWVWDPAVERYRPSLASAAVS